MSDYDGGGGAAGYDSDEANAHGGTDGGPSYYDDEHSDAGGVSNWDSGEAKPIDWDAEQPGPLPDYYDPDNYPTLGQAPSHEEQERAESQHRSMEQRKEFLEEVSHEIPGE